MKAILLKSEVQRDFPVTFNLYHWHCRICGKDGRVRRVDWRYVSGLGLTHVKSQHPKINPESVVIIEGVK